MPVNVEPTKDVPQPEHYARDEVAQSHSDNLRVKANTALILKELGATIEVTEEERAEAMELFKQIDGEDPSKPKQKKEVAAASTPGVAYALAGYISHYDKQVIADKVQLRNIAVNRLLEMSQEEDLKIAIKAVELLGKASDLFTEHQEITITHKNSLELQEGIREKIRLLMQMNTIDVTPTSERLTNALDDDSTQETE